VKAKITAAMIPGIATGMKISRSICMCPQPPTLSSSGTKSGLPRAGQDQHLEHERGRGSTKGHVAEAPSILATPWSSCGIDFSDAGYMILRNGVP
jgi:hypothetical protein